MALQFENLVIPDLGGHSGTIDTSFGNMERLVPRHFDHINSLMLNCHFKHQLQKSVL
jgi:hypothetical protein